MMVSPMVKNTTDTKDIFDAALSLPTDTRAELVEQLIRSLDQARQAQVDAAWTEEVRRRMAEVAAGKSQLIPGDEAIRMIRERKKV